MTRRGIGLLVAAVTVALVGRTFGVPELQMAGVAGLLLLVGAALLTWTGATRVHVDRSIAPATVWFGERASVTLRVHNPGMLPTTAGLLTDTLPDAFGTRPRAHLAALAPGQRATVRYDVVGAHRGITTIGPLTLTTGDPFGLVRRARRLPSTGTLTVYPAVWELPYGLPLGGATSGARDGRPRAALTGEDLADVREYVHGDDLRSVHWPSTAHRGRLMVRRAESSLSPRAVVLLDRRVTRHTGHGPGASIETAVAAAASTAYHLARRGRAIVLLDEPVTRPPRASSWEQVLNRLADLQPGRVDTSGLLGQVARGAAGDGALFTIVTTPDASELRALVRAGRGFATHVVLVIDVREHAGHGPDPDATAAVASLRAAGARAIVLRQGEPLDQRWRELLTRPRTAVAG